MTETTPAPASESRQRKSKNDRLVVRLESEIRAFLREKASRLGLDEATYVRTLIYGDVNGVAPGYQRAEAHHDDSAGVPSFRGGRQWPNTEAGQIARTMTQTEPGDQSFDDGPQVEEMDVPADPDGDLDSLMTAGPSLLDEMAALMDRREPPRPPVIDRRRQNVTPFRSRFANRNRGYQPDFWGPGSMTRAVGVGGELMGNMQGDGAGNVTRDNFAHLGAIGTRSR